MRTQNTTLSISTTSGTALQATNTHRVMMVITNISTTAVATVAPGETAAIANSGIVLQPGGSFIQADDGGSMCWQGPVQVIGDASGTIAIVEMFVE